MTEPLHPTGRPNSQGAYWLCQVGGWGAYGVAQFGAAVWLIQMPWGRLAAEILLLHGAGLGVTHALRKLVRRRRWIALSPLQLAWRVVFASIVASIPFGAAMHFMAIDALHNPEVVIPGGAPSLNSGLMTLSRVSLQVTNWAAIFVCWFVIYFVVVKLREQRGAELRQSELARALQQAELRLLKSQLNPHFLFNSLNTVRSLIAYDPSRAQDAVTRLANTLRYTLNSSQDELVTLAQELEIVKDYLELESMRFEERLSVDIDVPAEARDVCIPVMLLQTVVENAIKHGIAELPSGGVLRIRAAFQDDALLISVENPTPPMAPTPSRTTYDGVGLRNSAERLRLLFGTRAGLELDLSHPNVATTRIGIPRSP